MWLWYSELPTSTSFDRFLARGPSPGPVGSPPRRGSPRLSPACLSSCVHRPGCPGQRSLDHLARCAFEDASRTCSVRYHRAPPSGFSKEPPLYRHHSRCPLPAKFRLPLPSPSASRCQRPARSVLVVSHHLDGFLHRQLVGLLHPTADLGVHRVSTSCLTIAMARLTRYPRRCHTLQSFPHPQSRTCISADRCPHAVSSCVPGATRARRLQGFAPCERPLSQPPVAGRPRPLLSWASLFLELRLHRPIMRTADRGRRPRYPRAPLGGSVSVHRLESPACDTARRRHRARPMPATVEGWDFLPLHNRRTGRGQAHGASARRAPIAGSRRAARRMLRSCLCRETKTSARLGPRRIERTAACVKSRRKAVLGPAPRPLPALNPLRGRRTLRRSPLASGRPVVRAAGCAPAGRPPLRTRGQAGSHIAGSPRRHTPVPWTPWSPRCRDAVAACSPSGVLRWHHRGRLLHTCAPSRGRHRPALSGRPAGSVAQMRPHRPQHTPAASPWWPTRAAPCANRSRCSEVSTHRRYRARVKRHSAPPAPCSRRPHGRTFDRRAHVHPRVAFRCAGMFACT